MNKRILIVSVKYFSLSKYQWFHTLAQLLRSILLPPWLKQMFEMPAVEIGPRLRRPISLEVLYFLNTMECKRTLIVLVNKFSLSIYECFQTRSNTTYIILTSWHARVHRLSIIHRISWVVLYFLNMIKNKRNLIVTVKYVSLYITLKLIRYNC